MFRVSARYYDAIYSARGKDYEAEARRVSELVRQHVRSGGNSILDVACGTGTHLVYLRKEFQVEGLDIDGRMLEVAAEKLPGIPLHKADMATFRLPGLFDAVVCLFSSIAYTGTFGRMKRTVANMARHAKSGGIVIVEPWFYPEVFSPEGVHAVFVDQPDLKVARMNKNSVRDGVSVLEFHYLIATPEAVRRFKETHRLTLFRHEQYVEALMAANLEVTHDPEGLDGRGLFIGSNRIIQEENGWLTAR
jgi:SAM-dependent methyltransferase